MYARACFPLGERQRFYYLSMMLVLSSEIRLITSARNAIKSAVFLNINNHTGKSISMLNSLCRIPVISVVSYSFRCVLGCLVVLYCNPTVTNAEIRITPRISTGVEYTDNVFLTPVDEEYDVITFVSPAFDLSLTGRNSALEITYEPAYTSYQRFQERTYWRQFLTMDAFAEVSRGTRLELANFARYTEELDATDYTVRQGRAPYFTNETTLGMVNSFGAGNVLDLRYVYFLLDNEDPLIQDSAYQQPNLLFTYWLSPNRYAFEMEGRYTVSHFDVTEDFDDLSSRFRFIKRFDRRLEGYIEYEHIYFDFVNDGEDYRVYSPQVGFTWSERSNTSFAASFGYFYRDNEFSEDDDGIVGSFDMTHAWATGSSFGVNGRVGYDRAYFGAQDLGFNPFFEVGGRITYLLSRRITGSLEAAYRRSLFIDLTPDREDGIWRAVAGLEYQALPWLRFNLDYRYRQVNSNFDLNDYVENLGVLSVTLSPRQPERREREQREDQSIGRSQGWTGGRDAETERVNSP